MRTYVVQKYSRMIFTYLVAHACTPIDVPENGILVCNGWQTTYTKICKLICKKGFAYPPGFSKTDWYNCAASGHWFPGKPLKQCVPEGKFYDKKVVNL